MKELSIEEKAKRYDEAIRESSKIINHCAGGTNIPECVSVKATIEQIFPELKESEDEKIRKELLTFFKESIHGGHILTNKEYDSWIAWLEKQGIPAKLSEEEQNRFAKGVLTGCALSFIDYLDAHKYEGKMCVSNGECEDIENAFHNAMWDRLHRYYCKYIEKQGEQKPYGQRQECTDCQFNYAGECKGFCAMKRGEQKPINKAEPKFKVGDWVIRSAEDFKHDTYLVTDVKDYYVCEELDGRRVTFTFNDVHKNFKLWTIQDAKEGDVLYMDNGLSTCTFIYKSINNVIIQKYASYNKFGFEGTSYLVLNDGYVCPATKEQCELLFSKMKEAGYEWDAEKKELKKRQKHTPKHKVGDTIYYNSFGDVKSMIITNVTTDSTDNPMYEDENGNIVFEEDLIEYNTAWNEESSSFKDKLLELFQRFRWYCKDKNQTNGDIIDYVNAHTQELIDTVQNKSWGEEDEEMLRRCISATFDHGYLKECNWLKCIKDRVQPKQEWSEEDENAIQVLKDIVKHSNEINENIYTMSLKEKLYEWLKSLKDRVQPMHEWSKEDERMLNQIIKDYERGNESWLKGQGSLPFGNRITWLKSLRPQSQWKPSDEQMKALWNVYQGGKEQAELATLYNDLKKLK